MNRKTVVKGIAVLFILSGILHLWKFILSGITITTPTVSIDLLSLVSSIFLFIAGLSLFGLKEFGRRLSLFLLSIRAISIVAIQAWFLPIFLSHQNESVEFGYDHLGVDIPLVTLKNSLPVVLFLSAWLLIVILLVSYLLSNKTRDVFLSNKNTIATEPKP
ncbi:MAG: hypothetical protein WA821_21050 [Anaerolineales bacterium]